MYSFKLVFTLAFLHFSQGDIIASCDQVEQVFDNADCCSNSDQDISVASICGANCPGKLSKFEMSTITPYHDTCIYDGVEYCSGNVLNRTQNFRYLVNASHVVQPSGVLHESAFELWQWEKLIGGFYQYESAEAIPYHVLTSQEEAEINSLKVGGGFGTEESAVGAWVAGKGWLYTMSTPQVWNLELTGWPTWWTWGQPRIRYTHTEKAYLFNEDKTKLYHLIYQNCDFCGGDYGQVDGGYALMVLTGETNTLELSNLNAPTFVMDHWHQMQLAAEFFEAQEV